MKMVSLSVSQKIVVLLLLIALVAILVWAQYPSSERAAPIAADSIELTPRADALAPNIADQDLITAAPAAVAIASEWQAKVAGTTEVKAKDAWTLGNSKSALPQIPLNKVIRDYQVIEINSQPEAMPQVGETISLPLLNGQKVLVDIQSTSLNPNGDKSWSGHLQGYDQDYPIVMTYGERAVFAMITTPEGSYTMESSDGVGWVYKNPSEVELSDAGSNDFLETPHSH